VSAVLPEPAQIDDIAVELRDLADSFPGALSIVDRELRFVLAGGERLAATGYGRAALEGRTLHEVFPPSVCEHLEPYFRRALEGERVAFETQIEGAVYRTEVAPLHRAGTIVGAVSIGNDVTARVTAERLVRSLNEELETIFTQAPIGLALVALDGGWIRVNERICEIVGYSRDELLALTFQEITHPDDLSSDLDSAQALVDGAIPSYGMEKRYVHKDGSTIWIWLSVGLIRDEDGEPMHYVSQIEDITARKRTERYRETERAVASALAQSGGVSEASAGALEAVCRTMGWEIGEIWLLDERRSVLVCAGTWNDDTSLQAFTAATWTQTFTWGEGLPGTVWRREAPHRIEELDTDENFVRIAGARAAGLRSGLGLPLVADGRTIGTMSFFSRSAQDGGSELLEMLRRLGEQIGGFYARRRAADERRALELRLLEAQRSESLGVLAGGIAHDFNNLLVGVLGNATLLCDDLDDDDPRRALAQQIEIAATRAADLTRQMLAYTGQSNQASEALDISAAVSEMTQLVRHAMSKRTRVELDLDPATPLVEADGSQIRQVLMNLLTNAAEAIGDTDGTVSVRTAPVHADRALLDAHRFGDELPEGLYTLLSITDDGCGMTAETAARIFDPYFTTKFTGRGLGLAASLGIIRSHHGALRVTSAVGAGTRFELLLPAHQAPPTPTEPASVAEATAGHAPTVLVVDDEQIVREIAVRALTAAGHRALSATDGDDALLQIDRHRGDLDCVLLDLTMPGRSGVEVLEALAVSDPSLPVVVSSGYSQDALPAAIRDSTRISFLQKPYTVDELHRAVADAVAGV